MEILTIENCPDVLLAKTNRAILHPSDSLVKQGIEHIAVREAPKGPDAFIFSVAESLLMPPGKIGFNLTGRKWAKLIKGKQVEVAPYGFEASQQCIDVIVFLVDFNSRAGAPNIEFDVKDMATKFSSQFSNQAFTVGQLFGFVYDTGSTKVTFELTVKQLTPLTIENVPEIKVDIGLSTANTNFLFESGPGSTVKLTGGPTDFSAPQVMNQNWDFASMGIGGLSEQFTTIFQQAFAARLLPPQFADKLKLKFVKGILLHGPPGTGKTLIARQIGKMLLAREPKIVNGPELFNKYVGESEANIRKLFQEAEEEFKKAGRNSGLHVIIFDEIDALCKARGSSASSAGVGDNVVNQLLTKIDGVDALPNVLLIGMTNRKDLIDEALLRPGRLELQIEIGIPNQEGRMEIFEIHTKALRNNNMLHHSVSLEELSAMAKNYTGAEIEGLCRAAQNVAISRVIKVEAKIEITQEMLDSIIITRDDFMYAMDNYIKPALGASEDELAALTGKIITWDPAISNIISEFDNIIANVPTNAPPYFVLFVGDRGVGLTTLAACLASQSAFPFTRIMRAGKFGGEPDSVKIQHMKKLFSDAAKSEQSCVLIDNLASLINYSRIGPQYSSSVNHALFGRQEVILPPGRSMLVIITCSREVIQVLQLSRNFHEIIEVPSITRPEQVGAVLDELTDTGECPFDTYQQKEVLEALEKISFKLGIRELLTTIKSRVVRCEPSKRVEGLISIMAGFK